MTSPVAKADYEAMYAKYKTRVTPGDPNYGGTDPSNDCMGCARKFFCSWYIPRCDDDEGDVTLPTISNPLADWGIMQALL